MKRFLVLLGETSLDEQVKIGNWLGEQNFTFWHKFQNSWLIGTPDGFDKRFIADTVNKLVQSPSFTFDFTGSTFTSYMPDEWDEWFMRHWGSHKKTSASRAEEADEDNAA